MTPMLWISIFSIIGYVVLSIYRNRVKIYRLQKAGYVSLFSPTTSL